MPHTENRPQWRHSPGLTPYPDALTEMEQRVLDIRAGKAPELIWFLEHPPLYTAGTSAKSADLLSPDRFPVYPVGRGGEYTYHGPGQRVVYVMLDLAKRGRDVRRYVFQLEQWIIDSLACFDIMAERRAGRIGVWVLRKHSPQDGREDKIAAIGVRVRKWVSFHGLCINVAPNLDHYSGIVPCGIAEHGVTSCADLGRPISMADLDKAMQDTWPMIFDLPE